MYKYLCIILFAFLLLASACSSQPSQASIQTAIAQTQAAQPKVANTSAPLSTNTIEPTNTSRPSNTPKPTNTSKPTNTPLPPTPTPSPIYLSGSGDSIVDFENNFNVAIIHIKGNASGQYFGVTNYGSDGEQINLLVNTTEPYDGIRPLDFRGGEHTTRIEINATGEWEIEILPLTAARVLDVPGIIEGNGDDLIMLRGGTPDLAIITGNESAHYFGVLGYGTSIDLLVNTTDPYTGTIILNSDTLALEVNAEGYWSIEVTTK